jgi:hypothetical protein
MQRIMLLMAMVGAAWLALLPLAGAGQGAGGVTDEAFYVDGVLYRTVNTPTDLTGTGAPASSFDTIYDLGALQLNVATAAPGDPGFNGGRWQVHAVTFAEYEAAVATFDANGSGNFDSAAELEAALAAGAATDNGIVRSFVCPVIRVPGRQ